MEDVLEEGEAAGSFVELASQHGSIDPGHDDPDDGAAPLIATSRSLDHGADSPMSVSEGIKPWMIISSNASFFFGSILYLILSIRNFADYHGAADDKDDTAASDDSDLIGWVDIFLSSVAALMYVANAAFDFGMSSLDVQQPSVFAAHRDATARRFRGDDAHWEMGVAVTFGTAAVCDVVGAVTQNNPNVTYTASSLAVHIYLLNALLVVTGRRPTFVEWPEACMSAGDILFVIGSMIDVGISYWESPETNESTWSVLAAWDMTSSTLWFVDAVLYILADVIPDKEQDGESADGEPEHDVSVCGGDAMDANLGTTTYVIESEGTII